jgi:hypothetical protein
MNERKISNYLSNCLWLTIAPTLLSIFLAKYLPDSFQKNQFWNAIPVDIKFLENIFRTIVIILPVFFPISLTKKLQKAGLSVYLTGIALYLLSYAAQIYFPESNWSQSLIGFTAPATSPVIWLTGIGLIMDKSFFNIKYRKWIYIIFAIAFCVFHFIHTSIVYYRYY